MRVLSFCFLIFFKTNLICQELLLVIDEQFANTTFDSFDDLNNVQYNGELNWIKKSSLEGDNSHLVDLGNGEKLEHYLVNMDDLYIYSRAENAYTNDSGLIIEANNHGVINGNKSLSGLSLYYPWSFRRGYFEIEAKLAEGQGIVSTWFFFSSRPGMEQMCDGSQISNWQEIDVFETGGAFPNDLRNNIHWSNYLAGTANCNSCEDSHCQNGYDGVNDDNNPNFMTEFHKYGLYWDEDFAIFLIDGYVYRYWVNDEPLFKQFGALEPVRFEDAMVNHFTCQYGVQETIENSQYQEPGIFDQPDHLNPPNPNSVISDGQMEIKYFRYWLLLPCETQGDNLYSLIPGYPVPSNKSIFEYNRTDYGHFESGKNITCSDSEILPTVDGFGNEIPFSYPSVLTLVASNSITLTEGFHAKASSENYEVNSNFHGRIQTCSNIPEFQPMPYVQNLDLNQDGTFKEKFFGNMADMISESYSSSSPFKKGTLGTDEQNDQQHTSTLGVEVYPNPAENEIIIVSSKNELKIELLDSYGKTVMVNLNYKSNEILRIDNLLSGIYIIKITDGENVIFTRFIKL